jgi:hypothetical protein
MTFLNCPAYLDQEGAARCGLPAEVRCRFIMRSTDGPLQSAMIRCPLGHHFSGPVEFLTSGSDRSSPRDGHRRAVAGHPADDPGAGLGCAQSTALGRSVMKRIRIERRRARSERPWLEALSPDPRDPDIVRAKALAQTGRSRKAAGK